MLSAIYDGAGLEIEGTRIDLRELSRALKECKSHSCIPLFAPQNFQDMGIRYLKELVIEVGASSIAIWEEDEQLCICGAKEKLSILSANVEWLADTQAEQAGQVRNHMHVEFHSGHFFLAEGALPLLLTSTD